jgi:hypothetical protein
MNLQAGKNNTANTKILDGILEAIDFTDFGPDSEYSYMPNVADCTIAYLDAYIDGFKAMLDNTAGIERKDGYDTDSCIGHDIWLTTQAHGAGFWEGASRWTGAWAECDAYCKANRLGDAYVGDNGLLYISGCETSKK